MTEGIAVCCAGLVFPWMASKVQLPEKMAADHKTLLDSLDSCTTMVTSLKAGGNASEDAAKITQLKVRVAGWHWGVWQCTCDCDMPAAQVVSILQAVCVCVYASHRVCQPHAHHIYE